MAKYVLMVVLCLIFTGLGLAGGWFASAQKSAGGGGHGGNGGHGDAHGGGEQGHAGHHGPPKPKLSPQARQNLQITVAEADTQVHYLYKAIPATVVETPLASQPLFAPAGGTVMQVEAVAGSMAAPGITVVRILRDPLPRPALTLTEDILKPAGEQFHSATGDLRRALRGMEILKTELERIRKIAEKGAQDGLPVFPLKNEIDLRYDLSRAEQELENAREKLRLFGLSEDQLRQAESGPFAAGLNQQVWQRALQRNGLWTANAEALFAALPASAREAAWSVAAVGELTGAGLASPELAQWFKEDQQAGAKFLAIAALLQQGTSLQQIKSLHAMNAFNAVVDVKAPQFENVPDWDVREVSVKRFQRVEAGTKLLVLANPRQALLKAEPAGGEVAVVLNALKQNLEFEAVPLVDGSGPPLKGLKFLHVSTDEPKAGGDAQPTASRSTVAMVKAANEVLNVAGDAQGKFRTWQLREGEKYLLHVPVQKFENVFKLPSDAVTDDGPDKVVFIEDGDSFKAVKVAILHQDHEFAIIDSKTSELFPGDSVVQHGAFGLGMALKAGAGAVDPHAGHQH